MDGCTAGGVRARHARTPAAGFTGSAYDVVLLDHDVEDERGLEWLVNLRLRPGFPPIIYFGPTDHAELELRASAAGALRVLARTDFEHEQLARGAARGR